MTSLAKKKAKFIINKKNRFQNKINQKILKLYET